MKRRYLLAVGVVATAFAAAATMFFIYHSDIDGIIASVEDRVRDGFGSGKDSSIPMPQGTAQKVEASDFKGKVGNFAYVSSLDASGKLLFLDEVLNAVQDHERSGVQRSDYFNDVGALSAVLAQLALDRDQAVSGRALYVINLLAWVPESGSDLPNISKSVEIKTVLEQLIEESGTDDDLRGDAIDAHSLLYPPDQEIVRKFEKLLVAGRRHEGDTLTAVFGAFTKYKRIYDYDMPVSTLEAARKLIDHPSDSVKSDVLTQLRISVGKPILPVLFDELESSNSMSLVNETIMNILILDNSDETVRRLKEVADRSTVAVKVQLIEYHTDPRNIERLRGN